MKVFDTFPISFGNDAQYALAGAVVTAFVGNTSIRTQGEHDIQYLKGSGLQAQAANSAISADLFASAFFSAQHGNFQRLFLDLTRINVRLDFPSGLKFLSGAARVGYNLYNSQEPSWETIETLCPKATLSFQQQVRCLIIVYRGYYYQIHDQNLLNSCCDPWFFLTILTCAILVNDVIKSGVYVYLSWSFMQKLLTPLF